MKLAFPSCEFEDAVAAVCHGTAAEADMRGLNELLRRDAGARDEYLLRVELHARLAADPELFASAEPAARDRQSSVINLADWRNMSAGAPVVARLRERTWQVLALAACLACVALGAWNWWWRSPGAGNEVASTAVAMLVRTVDAQWGQDTKAVQAGSALRPGWLRLESGMAQVVFYSGARVVIEGPAALRLVSATEAALPSGRLLAEIPPPAHGFRLKTDQLDIVDLGTAFGISATTGQTEVHVFAGKVDLLPPAAPPRALNEGQAVVAQAGTALRVSAANRTNFAALLDFQERSRAAAAFRYEQWQFANARLNEDPSLVVHLEFQDLGAAGWTLHNSAQGDSTVPDATVVGCQRAEGRWREKQALEFQSVNDRLRLEVPGDFDALTLSAWVCVKGLARQFNSLFMCDGFEPGTIHWLIRNDGVLGLTVFGPEPGKFQIVASPPVLALDQLGMWLHLAVVVDGRSRQVVHYVNGNPVSRGPLKLGPPIRLGAAELGNWNANGGQHPAPALIRNLSGALDEFALFSRALADGEVRDLYLKGRPDL
jgi:hypothetical protein